MLSVGLPDWLELQLGIHRIRSAAEWANKRDRRITGINRYGGLGDRCSRWVSGVRRCFSPKLLSRLRRPYAHTHTDTHTRARAPTPTNTRTHARRRTVAHTHTSPRSRVLGGCGGISGAGGRRSDDEAFTARRFGDGSAADAADTRTHLHAHTHAHTRADAHTHTHMHTHTRRRLGLFGCFCM